MIMGDDATNGGAFMFVADKAPICPPARCTGKITQRASANDARTGAMDIQWINLCHATSAEIKALVDGWSSPLSDIMDVKTKDLSDAPTPRFTRKSSWLTQARPGKGAAFLETHRYAALAGGNLGFTKWKAPR